MKKLLLTLGAVASVAAPVAAVVACSNDNGTTDEFATPNKAIAKVIADNSDKALKSPIAKLMTKQSTPVEVYPKMVKEGDLKREIKIVNKGFTISIEIKVGKTDFNETYFIEDNKQTTIDALKAKIVKDYALDATVVRDDFTIGTPVALKGTKVAYFDATCQGTSLIELSDIPEFVQMNDAEAAQIAKIITDATASATK